MLDGASTGAPDDGWALPATVAGVAGQGPMRKCPWPVRVYRAADGKRLILPCRRRVCGWCGPRHWRPRVLAGLHAGLGLDRHDYLAVLLTAPGSMGAEDFNAVASKRWHHFVTLLRREYPGATLDFWRVAELQARGHVHFHFVLRGLRWFPVGTLRRLALQAGFGAWVGLRRPRDYPGGVRSVGSYFGKYLLKGYAGGTGVAKLVTFSNRWRIGWVDRRKASTGEWIFAGSMGAGWRLVGYEVAGVRVRVDARAAPWFAPWWRLSWQAARRGEAETAGAWNDGAIADAVIRPLGGGR